MESRERKDGKENGRAGVKIGKLEKSLKIGDGAKKMEELEERVSLLEKGDKKVDGGKGGAEVEERVRILERERERRERYETRNNSN